MKSYKIFTLILLLISCRIALAEAAFKSCYEDVEKQKARSDELQRIVAADQEDRRNWEQMPPEQAAMVPLRDRERRERVGAIFGEGCFKEAKDYAAAALVFQHGDRPDHFFQTFIWSKRGFELGDESQKRMMALGVDRYLVNSGHKQLFPSQAYKFDSCWCLMPIEETFPEETRKDYGLSIEKGFEWLKELNKGTSCPAVECKKDLKPSPKGTVPGFW